MHLMYLSAFTSLAFLRHYFQQSESLWHWWLQNSRVLMHLLSCSQSCSSVLQYFSMHSWGVFRITAILVSLRQSFAWAHFATSIAAWLPFEGRQRAQHEVLVPHFFIQSSRAGWHLGSFWQADHSLGHFYSMHCWGSLKGTKALTWLRQSLSMMHFQNALAAGFPFFATQLVQQVWLSLHSCSQSWRALRQAGSFLHDSAWSWQCSLMQSWGEKMARAVSIFY